MYSFRASKIVIIDSLDESDPQTGEILEETIRYELDKNNFPLKVKRYSLDYAGEFEGLINLLIEEVEDGYPILHIEMHGDEKEGLIFKNGSSLSWFDFVQILARLNLATEFNLVCVLATCYGSYSINAFWTSFTSPCFSLIAPNKEVDPSEVLRGFKKIYQKFLSSRDLSNIEDLLNREVPIDGGWFQLDAVSWFYESLCSYVETGTTVEVIAARAVEYKNYCHKNINKLITLKEAEEFILSCIYDCINYLYFENFFMVGKIPKNRERFEAIRKQAAEDLLPFIGYYSTIEKDETT